MGISSTQVLLTLVICLQLCIMVLWLHGGENPVSSFVKKNISVLPGLSQSNSLKSTSGVYQEKNNRVNISVFQMKLIGNNTSLPDYINKRPTDSSSVRVQWPPNIRICVRRQECINGKTNETTCKFVMRYGRDVCSRLMTVIRKPSRTGNQIFQVAAMLGIANIHGYTPVISKKFGIINIFNLPNVADLDFENNARFNENGTYIYTASINHLDHAKNWTITGHLQSWKYFQGFESIIRKVFTFKEKFNTAAKTFLKNVTPGGFKAVCIHVRRFHKTVKNGDYYNPSAMFIERAVQYFRKMLHEKVIFIFVSHSMPWVKANIKIRGAKYSPFIEPGSDLALMAHSDHVILTAGTFGWWGAWLSGGKVVYWNKFEEARAKHQKDFADAYYPNYWIGMD